MVEHVLVLLHGRTVGVPILTFSPKVFLPVTNLCRNRCAYCSFRRDPGDPGEWTMHPDEVRATLDAGRAAGCTEALLCLGDTPETGFVAYRALLRSWGYRDTVAYLEAIGEWALERGLLPHTNAGILSEHQLRRLRRVNVSMGLMLESASARLCEPGGPHARAADKRPERRLAMLETAGQLKIPFTTGLLVGIGETAAERRQTLELIAASHRRWGHVQEVIVQPFRAGAGTPMARSPEPEDAVIVETLALAREVLPEEVVLQAPPNLGSLGAYLAGGVEDLGGISPVTPDYINPAHPWPVIAELAGEARAHGVLLAPRLAVHPRFVAEEGWLAPGLWGPVERAAARLEADPRWAGLRAPLGACA